MGTYDRDYMRDESQAGLGFGGARGGRGGRGGGRPSMVVILIVANVAVFILGRGLNVFEDPETGIPKGALSRELLFSGHVWLLVTYQFVHGNVAHLAFNMFLVYMAGRLVETVMGPRRFLVLYFGSGLLAGVANAIASPVPMVGASGCAFGLLVAFGMILWDTQITALLAFIVPVRLRARMLVLGVVVIEIGLFVLSVVVPEDTGGFLLHGIAHIAHLGGALFGFAYCRMLGYGGGGRLLTRAELLDRRRRSETPARRREGLGAGPGKAAPGTPTPREFISREIDPILDKIERFGMQSLTAEERRILEAGSRKIAERQK